MERVMLVKQEVSEKQFKELRSLVNTIFQIIIICPDQGITEIPRIFGKDIICYIKAQSTQILDKKHRCRSGITFSKYMNLLESRYKHCQMMDSRIHRKIFIRKLFLLREIIVKCCSQLCCTSVDYCRTVQHPSILKDKVPS